MTIPSGISVNAPIGQGVVYHINDSGSHVAVTVAELFNNGVTVVFGGPAPFSRLDTEQATQYESACQELFALGIDRVIGIYCQDAFVCKKFKETIGQKVQSNHVEFYADGDGYFIHSYNLWRDFTGSGLGMRSERWCAVVENNVVKFVEHDEYSNIDKTHVDNIISWLKSQ